MNAGVFSSKTEEWGTPAWLFDDLNQEFGFTLDVCATPENAKCPAFFTAESDGLEMDWDGVCWMNPPYGRNIGRWIRKALDASAKGSTVVCLIPARTDTRWWHDYVSQAEVRFLRGRLYFTRSGATVDRAPFPSAVAIFRPIPLSIERHHKGA